MKFEISCISGGHSPFAVAFSTLHNNTAEYRILSDPSLQEMEHQGLCCDLSQLWGLMMMRNWSFTLLYLKRTGPQCHNLSMSGKNINETVSLYRFPTFLGFLTFSFFVCVDLFRLHIFMLSWWSESKWCIKFQLYNFQALCVILTHILNAYLPTTVYF